MAVEVLHGDCREVLPALGMRFHACVTDPPYHLTDPAGRSMMSEQTMGNSANTPFKRNARGFMGKTWDGGGVAFDVATWRAVYDALLPGGWLVAFGGTRTHHRMVCAIEDARFEIRDTMCWLYGSGFPKSLDVSKAIDRAAGAERTQVVGSKLGRPGMARDGSNQRSGFDDAFGGEPSGCMSADITAPATPEAAAWSGWGTALKPSHEPIVLARKPLCERTVAANVLRHGTGALNVDACRIEATDAQLAEKYASVRNAPPRDNSIYGQDRRARSDGNLEPHPAGRWPPNVVHDGSPEVPGGVRGVWGTEQRYAEHQEQGAGLERGRRQAGVEWRVWRHRQRRAVLLQRQSGRSGSCGQPPSHREARGPHALAGAVGDAAGRARA